MCSPKIPKPDPLIGQAAKQNSDIAQQQLDVAKQTLAWEKDRAKVQDPLVEKIVNQQITSGDQNAARATEQWNIYQDLFKPVEERMVSEAMNFDSPERQSRMAAEAGADVTRGYDAARDQSQRTMAAMGINPNSGRFAGLANENSLMQAKDTAGAMNRARRDTEMQGIALRTGAAQFGRNMPSTGIAADSMALNAGNSAVGNLASNSQIRNANNAAAMQWFGGATNANNSAGNLGLGLYQGAMQGAEMKQDAMGGIGSLIGTLGSAGMMAF
ncbi:MAG TPA: hypothetical protein VFS89_03770 [Nitrosospira sp.]|nr:hypothetical protein [Nitrosospira sp.]